MNGDVHRPQTNSRRYAAVLGISEAISACSDPQELATILADQLIDFLSFDHLDVVIFREKSSEIEWHAWGKGPLPFPDLPIEELPEWNVYNSQEALHIRDWSTDERFSTLKKLGAALGVDAGSIGSVIRVPLTTPHRRLGALGIASAPGITYSTDDVAFLQVIARVVAFAIDDGLNLRRAQQQTERLQLLLNLTSRITSSLKLRDLLRAISANIREVMDCDVAGISLPGEEAGTFRVYALDFPGGKGHVNEELIVSPGPNDPAKRAFETLRPVFGTMADAPDVGTRYYEIVLAEGIQNFCVLPLANRGRALGTLLKPCGSRRHWTGLRLQFTDVASSSEWE